MKKELRRILKVTNLDGKNYGFEISKFVVIDSPKAPVFSLEPLLDGTFRLCVNKSFPISEVKTMEVIRINPEDVIEIEGM